MFEEEIAPPTQTRRARAHNLAEINNQVSHEADAAPSNRAQLPNNMQMTWHEHADWFARDFLQRNFKRNASEKTVNFLFSQTDPIPSPGK